jgi:non-ribosomal peptide synthetase component F
LTLSTLLAAAYAEILAAWSATSHFCITVTSFNRPTSLHENISALLGDFTSTILLEIDARAPGFLDRAMALSRRLAADLDHAAVSGIQVLREAARQKGSGWASYVPIVFTSALGFQRPGASDAGSASWDRLGTTVFNVSSTPQVLIDHQISEEDGNLFCNWDVAESLFAPGTVEAMVAAYRALLGDLAAGRGWDRPVAATLPSLDHRAPLVPVPPLEPLHAAFERHARQTPDRLALVTPEGEFSYGVLDAAAGHLAAALLARLGGAEAARDRLVAIGFAKGWRQVLAVLAVLKAGAAYLPVDPALPPERRRLLIERSEALPLDDPALPEAALAAARAGRPVPALPPVEDAERLAYVIYTSGSTGEPKGVMIEHGAALGTVREVNRRWQVGAEDRVLGLSALGFDLSVYDIFGPLSAGGALILPNPAATRDPAHWAAMLRDHRATIWNSVPALMAMQCEYGLPAGHALRLVLLSGDWVPLELVPQLREQAPAARLVALGGATEAAIWSNCHEIGELDPDWPSMPYGTPLAGRCCISSTRAASLARTG